MGKISAKRRSALLSSVCQGLWTSMRSFSQSVNSSRAHIIPSVLGLIMLSMSVLSVLLLEPSPSLYIALAGISALWWVFSFRDPLTSFGMVFFVWILAYSRLSVRIADIEGPGNRGGISLGDLLWLGLVLGIAVRILLRGRIGLPKPSTALVLLLPYVVMAFLLPLIGVVVRDWPVSYALPGIRHVQWVSFAAIAFWLGRRYGVEKVFRRIVVVSALVAVLHGIYAALQLGYSLGFVSRGLLWLDDLFRLRSDYTWFFYPRATGLLVNPNSYGLLGAILFATALSLWTSKFPARYPIVGMTVFSVWALVSSGSRSAVLGLVTAGVVTISASAFFSLRNRGSTLVLRVLRTTLLAATVVGVLLVIASPFVPPELGDRISRLFKVAIGGVAEDPNAVARVEMWREALREHWLHYPFGTLVPASYALMTAIDSYYITTWTQGTLLYTLLFVLALLGVLRLAFSLLGRGYLGTALGLAVLGITGVVAGASLTLSPLLQSQVVALFWSLVGLGLALARQSDEGA